MTEYWVRNLNKCKFWSALSILRSRHTAFVLEILPFVVCLAENKYRKIHNVFLLEIKFVKFKGLYVGNFLNNTFKIKRNISKLILFYKLNFKFKFNFTNIMKHVVYIN